jgi:hypothetical protein
LFAKVPLNLVSFGTLHFHIHLFQYFKFPYSFLQWVCSAAHC